MTDTDLTGVRGRTLTAFFESRSAAEQAIRDLEAAGIPRHRIRQVDGSTSPSAADTEAETGFWASLKELFMPEEDRHGYAEGLRRGGFMILVSTDGSDITRVMDILDRDGAVDMDEREAAWRKEGLTGYRADTGAAPGEVSAKDTIPTGQRTMPAAQSRSAMGGEAGAAGLEVVSARPAAEENVTAMAAGVAAGAGGTAGETGGEEVVPIYEEQLRVGKRDVSHGRVRLRSYVVETPVEERVDLRQERVDVERRPVDRPVTGSIDDAFKERVIEVEERGEEVVVSKDVRLKEEVALRKQVEQRRETVADTVRRTEVEVQDDRDRGAAPAAPAASAAGRITEHMDVIASDGGKVGKVDHLEGSDRIKLTRTDSPDGQHHFVPMSWVERVDEHVHLNRTAEAVKAGW